MYADYVVLDLILFYLPTPSRPGSHCSTTTSTSSMTNSKFYAEQAIFRTIILMTNNNNNNNDPMCCLCVSCCAGSAANVHDVVVQLSNSKAWSQVKPSRIESSDPRVLLLHRMRTNCKSENIVPHIAGPGFIHCTAIVCVVIIVVARYCSVHTIKQN